MFPPCFEASTRTIAVHLVTLAVLCGCSVTHAPDGDRRKTKPDAAEATKPAVRRYPARVEVDGELGFTVTEVASISGSARATYQDALLRLAQNDYAGGIAALLEVTEQAPELTAPFIDLGIAQARNGDLEAAEASLREALGRTPDHPVANNELGIVLRRSGRFRDARRSYEKALAVQPGFHFARRNLAVLCDLYLADFDCAAMNYRAYLDSSPDDREVQMWLADVQTRLGIGP